VDIAAVARTCSEWPLLLAFLQRRHPAAHPTCDIKALLLTIVKVLLYSYLLFGALNPLVVLGNQRFVVMFGDSAV